MKRMVSACIILCFMTPFTVSVSANETETYETVYVNGQAPIVIDGDLSDWEWIGLDPANIANYSPLT